VTSLHDMVCNTTVMLTAHKYEVVVVVKHNQPITEAITKIEQCLTEVTDWCGKNQLKLNSEKSEAVIFLTSKQRNDLPSDISVTIGGHRVVPKPSVRNLGLIPDSRQASTGCSDSKVLLSPDTQHWTNPVKHH